jgi:hypothetical protein
VSLRNWFGRKPVATIQKPNEEELKKRALLNAIEAQKAEDPLVGVKIGARDIYSRLLNALQDDKGVHAETLLAVIGSLAGFSCIAAVSEVLVRIDQSPQQIGLAVVEGKDGKTYWFGDPLNKLLAENEHSVFSLIIGKAQALGGGQAHDLENLFRHVAGSVGGDKFGLPRIPSDHRPADTPLNFVSALWPKLRPVLLDYCDDPRQWPLAMALAAQEAQQATSATVPVDLAVTILLECAAPMAKIAPGSALVSA